MARIKYYYDTETCRYEKTKTNIWEVIANILGFILLSIIMSILIIKFYSYAFDSEKEADLRKENEGLKARIENFNSKIELLNEELAVLEKKDKDIYRVIFKAEPYQEKNTVVDTHNDNLDLTSIGTSEKIIKATTQKINELKERLGIQKKSYDEIVQLSSKKQSMLASIPAIRPLENQDINSLASGFGFRIHPIYKVLKMHTGLDFSAKTGTPIHATGDGVVVIAANLSNEGYGNQVEIDHGYGLRTKYAHMSKFHTHVGKRVKRGEIIGEVGNTGTSVAPHLHYEVIKSGQKVNPVNYFYNDITPAEYQRLIEISKVENQSLGGE